MIPMMAPVDRSGDEVEAEVGVVVGVGSTKTN